MSRFRRTLAAAVAAAAFLASATGSAAAHEIQATRFDAPLPLSLLYLGAGATVALTALWLARTRTEPAERAKRVVARVPHAGAVSLALSVGFLAVALAVLWIGATGRQTPTNPAVVVFWALWLKGLLVVAAVVGSPWRVLSPWRTVHRALERLEGGRLGVTAYPGWLAEWPAFVGFLLVVGVFENLTVLPEYPARTSALVAVYAGLMVGGGVVFGREWFARADFLSVLYRLVGRVSPVRVERDGERAAISLRRPWTACARPVRSVAVAAFVVASVYTVSFDGFTNTPEYQTLLFAVRDLGGGALAGVALYAVGLACFLVAFAVVAALTARAARDSVRRVAVAVPATLMPIAVGYELAHNAAFVVRNVGVLAGAVTGDPIALLGWLSLPAYWGIQVVLVVLGHVVAVAAAHRTLADRYPDRTGIAHAPLVVLMVAYTVISLWILSRPVVV